MFTRRAFVSAAAGCAGLLGCRYSVADSAGRGGDFQKGVNFTAERPDKYESAGARSRLAALAEYGVNSVALVPYGWCRLGSPDLRFDGQRSWERDTAIETLAQVARSNGMKVFLKPQIWVPRGFPGELEFERPEERAVWFSRYEAFLRHYATLAARIGADLFSVGVEFSRLARYEDQWRRLIALARGWYSGPLVYAANWGREFESIGFWDALDLIGLNNYYPLPDDLAVDGVVSTVAAVQRRFNRPVIFPEAGFPSIKDPHREPWAEPERAISLEDQARCYEAVFAGFYNQPWFHGVYWWKVGSNGRGGAGDASHTPWRKPAMEVVRNWYTRGQPG